MKECIGKNSMPNLQKRVKYFEIWSFYAMMKDTEKKKQWEENELKNYQNKFKEKVEQFYQIIRR